MKKTYTNDTSQEVYAARLGRHMFLVATRKAIFAARISASLIGQVILGRSLQPVDISHKIEPQDALVGPDDWGTPDAEMPNSVSEFLQLLAEELETAEIDPDDPPSV